MPEAYLLNVPDHCRGKWVALRDAKLFAWGDTVDATLAEAEKKEAGSSSKCFLKFVTEKPMELIL